MYSLLPVVVFVLRLLLLQGNHGGSVGIIPSSQSGKGLSTISDSLY